MLSLQNWHPPPTAVRHLAGESQITPSCQLIQLPEVPSEEKTRLAKRASWVGKGDRLGDGVEWGWGALSAEFSPEISPCSEVSISILSPGQKDLRGNLRCPPRGMLSIPAHCMASVCGRRPSLAASRSKRLGADIC